MAAYLPPGEWLIVTCGLTAVTPWSSPGLTTGNEYGRTLLFLFRASLDKISTDVDKSRRIARSLCRGFMCNYCMQHAAIIAHETSALHVGYVSWAFLLVCFRHCECQSKWLTLSPHSTTPTPPPTFSRRSSRSCRRACRCRCRRRGMQALPTERLFALAVSNFRIWCSDVTQSMEGIRSPCCGTILDSAWSGKSTNFSSSRCVWKLLYFFGFCCQMHNSPAVL